ncbi:hypothetical protein [Tepidibacter formicigenes]|jgi:hypothetical protein|uniref:Uncharacterized protein n=1 Tax=Tepidibacter formicigenes DSM 15518 TaxID=1123349 RepID=A0A1M6SMP9_9FIRM|nr:hypothetical protein [Tepidibacter formicigenes]SHK46054.1 hypothetical protein SAMN02744037_02384 [Tepidibacter formicigenes DSM 15518]
MNKDKITEIMKLTKEIKENTQCTTREALEAAKEFFGIKELEIHCLKA